MVRKITVRIKPQSRLFNKIKIKPLILKTLSYIIKTLFGLALMLGLLVIVGMIIGINPYTNEHNLVSFINTGIENTNVLFFWLMSAFTLGLCYLVFDSLFQFKK